MKKLTKQEKKREKKHFRKAMEKELREHKSSFIVLYTLRILVLVVLFMNETLGSLKEKQQLKKEIKKYKKKTSYTTEESSELEALEKKLKLIEEKNQGEQKTKEKIHWNTYMIVSLVARFFNEFSTIIIESMYINRK